MKILSSSLLAMLLTVALRGEVVTLFSNGDPMQSTSANYSETYSIVTNLGSSSASVIVRTGDVARVVSVIGVSAVQHEAIINIGSGNQRISSLANPISFVGPGSVTLKGPKGTNASVAFVTLDIQRTDEVSSAH